MRAKLASVLLCAAIGPCIIINPTRQYYVTGENAIVCVTVEKQESIDAKVEGSITGIEASATASATVDLSSVKEAVKDEVTK